MPTEENTLVLKRSGVENIPPYETVLAHGEIAINYADNKLYYRDATNTIASLDFYDVVKEIYSEETPNASTPAVGITPTTSVTNADIVIRKKGTGAILAQIPDNTIAGGNKRGTYSIDLQHSDGRVNAADVASGVYSAAFSTDYNSNKVSGQASLCITGTGNIASGAWSCCVGGSENTTSGSYSFIGLGILNVVDASFSSVCGSSNTTVNGMYSASIATDSSINSGDRSMCFGGSAINTGDYSVVFGPFASNAARRGAFVLGSNGLTGKYIHAGRYIYTRRETATTAFGVGLYGQTWNTTDALLTLLNNSAYLLTIRAVMTLDGSGLTKTWKKSVLIKRGANAASTTLVYNNTDYVYGETGTETWDFTVTANTTYGAPKLEFLASDVGTKVVIAVVETNEIY